MWKLASWSFSKSAGSKTTPDTSAPSRNASSSANSRCSASSASLASAAASSSSSTAILPADGAHARTGSDAASPPTNEGLRHAEPAGTNVSGPPGAGCTPYPTASRLAVLITKLTCCSSRGSNSSGSGNRLEPDQNGSPVLGCLASRGNSWVRSRMRSRKKRRNRSCACATQRRKRASAASARIACTVSRHRRSDRRPGSALATLEARAEGLGASTVSRRSAARYAALSATNLLASANGVTNRSVNCARDHSMQWSISDGKLRSVHMGMLSSSSASLWSPYDSVLCGSTTCTLHLVPSVPDSSSGLP
mmetsp:Transcript_29787/g.97490  ORF Transcript_29787/g.97490 Transcript_29787/m.97490 type:complete len:307 (+) Transcript_29787:1612-2532(+)